VCAQISGQQSDSIRGVRSVEDADVTGMAQTQQKSASLAHKTHVLFTDETKVSVSRCCVQLELSRVVFDINTVVPNASMVSTKKCRTRFIRKHKLRGSKKLRRSLRLNGIEYVS